MSIRSRFGLGIASGGVALLALLWYAAFHLSFFERADRRVLFSFYNLTWPNYRHHVHATASLVVSLCDPIHYAFLAVLPVAVALARRRAYHAGAVLVLVVGAGATTLALKHLVPQAESFVGVFSPVPYPRFPSGHSTAAMALVLSLTFVTPARLRPVVAGLGAVFAAAVGYSLLTIGSHYPSDVLAGFLVAAIWSVLTMSVLREFERRLGASPTPLRPITVREALTPPGFALLAILTLAVIVILSDPQSIISYIRAHHTVIVGTVVIAALSTTVSTGIVLSVRNDVTA